MKKKLGLKWIPWVLSIAFLIFLLNRLTEYDQLKSAFVKGDWWWMAVAVGCQILFYVLLSKVYQISFEIVGMKRTSISLFPVVLAAVFVNTATPSAGLAGTALYVKDAQKRGFTAVRGIAGFSIETVIQQIGFLFVSIVIVSGLYIFNGSVGTTELMIVGLVAGIIVVQIIVLIASFFLPHLLEHVLSVVSRMSNWVIKKFRKKNLVSNEWPRNSAAEMKDIVGYVWSGRRMWFRAFFFSVVLQLSMNGTLYALIFAFRQGFNIEAGFGAYVVNNVAGAVLLGPQGVGVVEIGLALVVTHYGVVKGAAALIAIVFRALNFWLPMLAGFICFRKLRLFE